MDTSANEPRKNLAHNDGSLAEREAGFGVASVSGQETGSDVASVSDQDIRPGVASPSDQETKSGMGLLRFVACGSVDDGKSTLIGRMLYDAKLIFADQAQTLELDSRTRGAEGEIDYSLLLDGLFAEREQGITIDVAYRYFATEKRSFIVADCPGHEEYTRNMAVGASASDLAVILVDVTKGLLPQTHRHARICSLVGIRHFVFAVNKMDEVDYDQHAFDQVSAAIKAFMEEFPYEGLTIIPTSAKQGENVTSTSDSMPWYTGLPLLACLEQADVNTSGADQGFTLPVQRVCRLEKSRGYQGTVASGSLSVNDAVCVFPSETTSHVTQILVAGKPQDTAYKGQAVTVALADELDISRGCVIEKDSTVEASNLFVARLLWMDEAPLVENKSYLFKLGTKEVPGSVYEIACRIEEATGDKLPAKQGKKNEILECKVVLSEKVVYERFCDNRMLGSMILIDRLTNATAAAGVIDHKLSRADNLTYQQTDITRKMREQALQQRGVTIWLTGLSGSGKSTLANEVEKQLHALGIHTMLLDGDNIRLGLNKNLGFTEADRIENIRRIAEVAKLLNDGGLVVLTAFISPFAADRQNAKDIIGEANFIEVFVSTPLEECERRDVKGLYKKARAGEIPNFTGISSPYEAPECPQVEVNTADAALEDCAKQIIEKALPAIQDKEL